MSDAVRAELRSEDAQARRLAQCEFGAPLVLEAGAGTGKTAALVARIEDYECVIDASLNEAFQRNELAHESVGR